MPLTDPNGHIFSHDGRSLNEWVSGNIFVRPNPGAVGRIVPGHQHNFDHTTIFFTGQFRIKATFPDGRTLEELVQAPAHRLIRAEVTHEIEFLSDGEFWCVYSHRDPTTKEVVPEYNGWMGAYV